MASNKCVVEGCHLEYDVVCSFSFYNLNTSNGSEDGRQEWIEGAMQTESECMWRHVNLQLCGYHFELDTQGLWIDSPMMPELLTVQASEPTPEQAAIGVSQCPRESFHRAFEQFVGNRRLGAILMEHNYSVDAAKASADAGADQPVSRLNVRQLVDTLGYLSLKSLQRKQLWVVKVETDKAEASITQSEQVITKMTDSKQIIELIPNVPQQQQEQTEHGADAMETTEEQVTEEETTVPDDFIYEIAEEQEITMDEVREEAPPEPPEPQEWTVNIVTEKPKYAYIKHCTTGKKKRHFTTEMNHITLQGDYENYYILPDADPSVGIEITTTNYEPENYIVEDYQHLVLEEERPKKKREPPRKKKKMTIREQVKHIKSEMEDDWVIENNISGSYEENSDDDKKGTTRVRRKNKKYLGYDFVT